MAEDDDYFPPLDGDCHSNEFEVYHALGGMVEDDNLNMFLNVSGEIEEEEGVGAVDLDMLPRC